MTVTTGEKATLVQSVAALWPSLPFMAFGLWGAWSALAYSGSIWLSDTEPDGTYLTGLYILSTFAVAVVFLLFAVFAHRGADRLVADNRVVMAGGLAACGGCAVIILVGPYYLGGLLGSASRVLFRIAATATGLGTALIGLRCGVLYGNLPPRRALTYAALAQLVSVFVYLLAFFCPSWAPIEHGPSLSGIAFFCLLPLAAAFLACVPSDRVPVGKGSCGGRDASADWADAATAQPLPPTFWRFAVFTFCMSLMASMVRSAVVTTHALASTVEGNNLLMVLRVVMAVAFVLYGVQADARGIGLGKVCMLVATFASVVTACIAALGGLTNAWSLVIYSASSIFEFLVWCLLSFVAMQKSVSAVVVFGYGRGLFMLGCGVGWLLGSAVMPLVPAGPATAMLFMVMAGTMLLLALVLFSEKDYERLFSPVSEQELSLEDLFDLENRERELLAERRSEKRGRFSRAVEDVVQAYGLSAREGEVLRCLAMGYGSDRIAEHLQVKVNTVRAHTHNVYVKLDVHSREELMKLVDDAVARY